MDGGETTLPIQREMESPTNEEEPPVDVEPTRPPLDVETTNGWSQDNASNPEGEQLPSSTLKSIGMETPQRECSLIEQQLKRKPEAQTTQWLNC